jgi:hypothetical protein
MNNSKPSDPLKRLRPGDRLSGIPADAWNAMADAARADRAARTSVTAEAGLVFRQSSIIKVKNVSGSDVPRGGVVELTGFLIDPADSLDGFLAGPAFEGDTPAADATMVAVAIDPTPDSSIGRFVVSGVAVAKVDVTDEDHLFCRPDGSVDEMVSDATRGPCRILAQGEGYAYVLLGAGASAGMVKGVLDGSLAQGGSATMSVWVGGGDTGVNVTVNDWLLKSGAAAIAAGKHVIAGYIDGTLYAIDWECP